MITPEKVIEVADELTESREHIETLDGGWTKSRNRKPPVRRVIRLPGLIQQLHEAALDPSAGLMEGSAGNKPKSRPPVALEALSAYNDIERGSVRWVRSVRLAVRPRPESNIRALVGIVYKLDLDTLEALYGELRQWHRWAAVMTGWDKRPFQPRIECPYDECGAKCSIWINIERRLAMCKQCEAYWEGDQIGDLAELVRSVA